jgi:hypothetical protein
VILAQLTRLLCWDFVGTKRIDRRVTTSQIAAASSTPFLLRSGTSPCDVNGVDVDGAVLIRKRINRAKV